MRGRVVGAAVATSLVLGACTGGGGDGDTAADGGPAAGSGVRAPEAAVDVVDVGTPASAALGVSRRLFTSADVVVVAAPDADAQVAAERAARALGAPMLLPGRAVPAEIERLGADTVLAVGADAGAGLDADGVQEVEPTEEAVDAAVDDLPRREVSSQDLVVLTRAPGPNRAAVTTARVAGATVVRSPSADPRVDPDAAKALTERPDATVLALGSPFRHGLDYQVSAVRDDLQQPGGGLTVFPGRHVVALYGHPGTPSLGLLGEQGVADSVERADRVADRYRALTDDTVVPAFEVIATVASASKGKDGDYSAEADVDDLRPLVDAAAKADMYVILDLQPGRTDFLTQAKRYASLLEEPHVGLALDPEWRIGKKQKHLEQIGSVSAAEVNDTADWLATLTREKNLPQKPFVLHQFSTSMIRDRSTLDTSHPELSTIIHVDGQGTPGAKLGTWAAIRRDAPADVHWGWKNFHDEDEPMLTARQTWGVDPRPDLVTYQ